MYAETFRSPLENELFIGLNGPTPREGDSPSDFGPFQRPIDSSAAQDVHAESETERRICTADRIVINDQQ